LNKGDEERRESERIDALVLLKLDEDGRYGVTRDVSERGLLIATRSRFAPGETLAIVIQDVDGPLNRNARVVRVTETPPEESWRYRVALELDEPLPRHVIERGADAAAKLSRPGAAS
jgi:predicted DCC family thiol-disulfide oxidoreductase YuxK